MRFYGMYYLCKKNISYIKNFGPKRQGESYILKDWKTASLILVELMHIPALQKDIEGLYDSIALFHDSDDEFSVAESRIKPFVDMRMQLVNKMEAIIYIYESIFNENIKMGELGFDIKLPNIKNIGQYSECLKDLNFVFTQCPYLTKNNTEIKYEGTDIGSVWITFLIGSIVAAEILGNLSKLIDIANKAKSTMVTIRQQEEVLRTLELKTDVLTAVSDTYKKVNDSIISKFVIELENELGELRDGEERDKVIRSMTNNYFRKKGGQPLY